MFTRQVQCRRGIVCSFCDLLESQGISTQGGFGVAPRPKWQTMVRALEASGLLSDFPRHGVKGEAFLFRPADYLEARPVYRNTPFSERIVQ